MAEREQDLLRATLRSSVSGILWAALFGLFVNAFQLVVPLYTLQIYDRVVVSQSVDTLVMLTVVALGSLAFLGSMDFIRSSVFIVVGERFVRRLSAPAIRAAIARSLRAGPARSAQAMRDLNELRQFFTSGPIALPFDAAFAPVFLLVLFLVHPVYGFVALGSLLVLVALSVAMELMVRRPSQTANEVALQSHAEVGSAIRNAELIESMGMLGAVIRRWQTGQDRALRLVGAGNAASRALTAAAKTIRMGLQVLMVGTGASLVIDGAVTAGTIVAATLIMSRLLMPFERLIEGWRVWGQAIASYRRLRALLDEAGGGRQETPFTARDGALRVERVTYVPPGADMAVLRNVDFALESGELLTVTGPSGAGKSTLARLMVGVWPATAGGVFLDGQNVFLWERSSFGASAGYLPQIPALLDGTIAENIARFRDASMEEVIGAARRVGAHEMIGRLPMGYETRVGDGGRGLSGGQRQRVALARAFFGTPRLIVLDEPNTFLDSTAESDLISAVQAARADGSTVVVISHRPSMADIADKVLVLRDGMVGSFGPPEEAKLGRRKLLEAEPVPAGKIAHFPVPRIGRS